MQVSDNSTYNRLCNIEEQKMYKSSKSQMIKAILLIYTILWSNSLHSASTDTTAFIIPQDTAQYATWLQQFNKTKTGLYIKIVKSGKGVKPDIGDLVLVNFTGKYRNNTEFDTRPLKGEPLEFNVGTGQVILGWDEALRLMTEGTTAWLVVPPDLGYGNHKNGTIPANTTLYFEIELLKVVPQIPIEPYKVDNNSFITTSTGIRYCFVEKTSSTQPDSTSIVTIHYTGYLPDGKIFATSVLSGNPEKFRLAEESIIAGLREAIMLMPQGSKARFTIPSELAYGDKGYYTLIEPNTPLTYDIELLEIKTPPEIVAYISGNDTVMLDSGLQYIPYHITQGKHPESGDIVGIHYTGYLDDGKMFDSSILRDQHIMFAIGEGHVIEGLDQIMRTMHVGDKIRALIPWYLAYKDAGNPPLIPPKANLIMDVELLFIVNK